MVSFTPPMPSMTKSPSDDTGIAHNIEIKRITIFNHMNESVDLKEIFLEMNLYNSVFEPAIYGDIILVDSHSLLTRLPIIGEERIEIEFNTPGNDIKLFKGVVYTVKEIAPDAKGAKSSYVLNFCSEEILQNFAVHVAKSYKNTLNAEQIVEDILKTYLGSDKPLFIDPCRDPQKILIIPYLRPYDAIDFLKNRVKSADEDTCDYFEFFERFDGIYFKNLPGIISSPLNKEEHVYYYMSGKYVGQRDAGIDIRRIINLKINSKFDTINKINEGLFSNEAFEYSFDDKMIYSQPKTYKDSRPFLGKERMNTTGYTDNFIQVIAKGLSGNMTTFKERRTDQNFNFVKPAGLYMMSRIALSQISLTITVPGDTTVDIGDVISLDIPEFDAHATEVQADQHLSGRYLICSIRNTFLTPDKHVMQMDLYKDGFNQPISGMNNKLKESVY